jgi:N-methylhydantoinase A
VVEPGARSKALREVRTADMRYRGQGHEIAVNLPVETYRAQSAQHFAEVFEAAYRALFGRTIPGLGVEILSWTLRLSDEPPAAKRCPPAPVTHAAKAKERREIFDASQARFVAVPVYWRGELKPGEIVEGPAVIAEDETSTFITGTFTAHINGLGYITLSRRRATASAKEVA